MASVGVNAELCDGCGECVQVCATEAVRIEDGKAVVGPECIVCLACVSACSKEAILEPERPKLPLYAPPLRAELRPASTASSWQTAAESRPRDVLETVAIRAPDSCGAQPAVMAEVEQLPAETAATPTWTDPPVDDTGEPQSGLLDHLARLLALLRKPAAPVSNDGFGRRRGDQGGGQLHGRMPRETRQGWGRGQKRGRGRGSGPRHGGGMGWGATGGGRGMG